ncbi:5'-nucleotidase domain-containing protein 2-like, partial [Rhincodon typus]|uniref:5'-nucleotidase domain-containing protein 2-like n=1 Tax=Rhincodon typus TaxID=259920 RepID=UPI00202DB91C
MARLFIKSLSASLHWKAVKFSAASLAPGFCTKGVDVLPFESYEKRSQASRHSPADPIDASRPSTTGKIENKTYLWSRYNEMKKLVHELIPPGICNLLNPANIYSNNEVNLGNIEIYGFDYDYTLAQYSNLLHTMIFNTAREILIDQYKYPEGIRKYEYQPNFAIRGLHYDVRKGFLMKIDAFHYVQLGTVYRGLSPVPDEEVFQMYDGTQHVPLHRMSDFYGKLIQIRGNFSLNTMMSDSQLRDQVRRLSP